MALWEDLCGHTPLYLVGWYLVPVTRDFSHKHTHIYTHCQHHLRAINLSITTQVEPFIHTIQALWIQSQWYTHTKGARGCSTWLGFLMLGHSIVHWNTTEVPYCSEPGIGKKSPGITTFLPVSHPGRYSPIQCQWALNPQGLNKLVWWWLYLVPSSRLSIFCVFVCERKLWEMQNQSG